MPQMYPLNWIFMFSISMILMLFISFLMFFSLNLNFLPDTTFKNLNIKKMNLKW